MMSGLKIYAIETATYDVNHGEQCPIPSVYSAEECIFVPITGYRWYDGGSGDYVREYEISSLQMMCTGYSPDANRKGYSKVIGMRADRVCLCKTSYSYSLDSGTNKGFKRGYLKVLVIATKRS